MRIIVLAFSLICLGLPLAAEDNLRQMTSLDSGRPWQAVGRLNIGQTGFCTATLIAPDLVLTAAHCFYNTRTGQRVDAEDVEFLAGWRDGRASAQRRVRQIAVHPDYVWARDNHVDRVASDLAVVRLSHPINGPSIAPFPTGPRVALGQSVQVVSYAKDRAEAPSIQERCDILAGDMDLLVTSCLVDFGASGAPVFALENGVPKIVSVISARADWRGQNVSLASRLDRSLVQLLDYVAHVDGVFRRTPRFGQAIADTGLRARFKKP